MHGYRATDIAWEVPVKSSSERLIVLALAKFSDENCESFPSFEAIAKFTKLNRKTVIAGLKSLAESGVISVQKSGHTANLYRLIGSPKNGGTEIGSPKLGSPNIGSPKNGTVGVPKAVPGESQNWDGGSTEIGTRTYQLTNQLTDQGTEAPENVFSSAPASEENPTPPKADGKSKKQRSSKKKENEEPPIECPDGINVHYFNAVNAARRKKRVPVYTQTTWGLHCKAAEKCGLSPNDALEIAAEAGWAGFRACYYKPDQRKPSGPTGDPTQDIFK